MSASLPDRVRRTRRASLWFAGAAVLCAALLTALHPAEFVPAYRFAVFAALAPAVGSLLFLLIYRSTGGQWGDALSPFLRAGTALLPWVWLFALPLLWLAPRSRDFGQTGTLQAYLSHTGVLLRAIAYTVAFFLFWWAARRDARATFRKRGPSNSAPPESQRSGAFGPVGLILATFLLHLVAVDWLLALEPGWFSTAFPLVWMVGQAVAGLACAVLAGLALGLDPAVDGRTGRAFGLDWGNLLLTGVIFWSYLAFMQFLIIWNGNLPREAVWYTHRSTGLWRVLLYCILGFYFVLPFLILLSRKWKRRPAMLGAVAASLLLSQFAYLAWMILPSFPRATNPGYLLAAALAATAVGAFFQVYLRFLPVPERAEEVS